MLRRTLFVYLMEINNGHDTVLRHIDTQVFDRSYFRSSRKLLSLGREATSLNKESYFRETDKQLPSTTKVFIPVRIFGISAI